MVAEKPTSSKPKKNKYGQYFTPEMVADFMLSLSHNLTSKSKILEPSCGEGIFLKLLQQQGFQDITAYEIDNLLAQNFDFVKYESFISAKIDAKFDLIIGNPPYIRWKNLESELKDELENNHLWNKYFNSLCDYLYIFILKSIELLHENGQLIFICPEYWMNTTHSESLRNYMMKNGYFESIYHFNETPIFDKATVSVVVFKYVKSTKKTETINITKYYKNKVLTKEVIENIKQNNTKNTDIQQFKVKQFQINQRWLLTEESELNLIQQFEKACKSKNNPTDLFGNTEEESYSTIGEICDIGNGMVSGLDKAFQLNGQELTKKETQNTLNVIKAKDLQSYDFQNITKYIFIDKIENEEDLKLDFPHFYEKLAEQKEKLNKRYQYSRNIPYWEWVFLRNYKLFSLPQPRIFVPCKERISNKNHFRFSYVPKNIYPTQDVTGLFLKENIQENIYYVLAFLNNYRVFVWLKNKGIMKGNIVEFSEKPISSIPFRKIDWKNKDEINTHKNIVNYCKNYIESKNEDLLENINKEFDKLLTK